MKLGSLGKFVIESPKLPKLFMLPKLPNLPKLFMLPKFPNLPKLFMLPKFPNLPKLFMLPNFPNLPNLPNLPNPSLAPIPLSFPPLTLAMRILQINIFFLLLLLRVSPFCSHSPAQFLRGGVMRWFIIVYARDACGHYAYARCDDEKNRKQIFTK